MLYIKNDSNQSGDLIGLKRDGSGARSKATLISHSKSTVSRTLQGENGEDEEEEETSMAVLEHIKAAAAPRT